MNRSILCIDLKSFYATCECIERNLDPFTTPLVVASKKQGDGAITLAVTPYLKDKGVSSRGRLFEIPKDIKYILAPTRMSLYIKKSKEVINIYLDFVSIDDLHVYSVDEAFLDVTDYLKYHKLDEYKLAKKILKTIYKNTGLYATCGIGPNMFLAKVALDNDAKYQKDYISKWTYEDVKTKLWPITPLSNMWGIGKRLEKSLNNLGIFKVGDIANTNIEILKSNFGVIGEEIWNHSNGYDESIISEKYDIRRSTSYSNSQILFKDYNTDNIKLIISEMLDTLLIRLRTNNKVCSHISLSIGYSRSFGGGFNRGIKLDTRTDDYHLLLKYAYILLDKFAEDYPIRKVSISLSKISSKDHYQYNLFEDYNEVIKKDNINKALDLINNKYGKNTILKATSRLEDSSLIDRNNKIGGHGA